MLKVVSYLTAMSVGTVFIAECLIHSYVPPRHAIWTRSYHIQVGEIHVWPRPYYSIQIGEPIYIGERPIWPLQKKLLSKNYCLSYKEAKQEYDKCVKASPDTNYKLTSNQAVVKGFFIKNCIGVVEGTNIVHESKQ